MQGRDVVVVGGSAGAVAGLQKLVGDLPADLPACVLVVVHLPRTGSDSLLPAILARCTALHVASAVDGAPLTPGTVLIAPPERHLLVRNGRVALSRGPVENGHRPAVDALFRSAAHELRGRVVGVVLTGNLDDGSAGLLAVHRHGGSCLVQDPEDALFPGMPSNALAAVPDAGCWPLADLGQVVDRLVRQPAAAHPVLQDVARRDALEVDIDDDRPRAVAAARHPGTPSGFSCPDCDGVLWEIEDGPLLRFRCRVGHSWGVEGLAGKQDENLDRALWVALRALEEKAALTRKVAASAEQSGRSWSAKHFTARADETDGHARALRRLLLAPVDARSDGDRGDERPARLWEADRPV